MRVRHQVRLELRDINIQRTIETQRCRKRRDDLAQEAVQVRVRGPLDVQIASTNIVKRFVVVHDGNVSVLQQGVNTQDCVVWLNDSSSNLRTRPDCEAQLRLLAVVHGKSLKHEATKTSASATTACIEDEEALQARTIVGKLTDAVQNQVDDFFPDGIMTTCEIVRGVLLTSDQLLWMEKLTVCARTHLVNHGRFQVDHHAPRNMLSSTRFTEKCIERII